MTLGSAIKTCFAKYAVFEGRAPLAEFWWWALFVGGVVGAALAVDVRLAGVVFAAVLLPSAAVAARRLHDTNRSGWWALLALFPFPGVPYLGALLVFEGTRGPNRFGVDPLGRAAAGPDLPMPGDAEKRTGERMVVWQHRR